MTRTRNIARAAFAACAVLATANLLARAATYTVRDAHIVVVCPLTIGGSFDAKTTALSGQVVIEGDAIQSPGGTLVVDLSTLDTGNDLRNEHMRGKYLQVESEGFKDAKLSGVKLAAAKLGSEVGFQADFTLHGETKAVKGKAKIVKNGEAYVVEASFPVTVTEFKVPKPSYLGIGVEDEVLVKVSFTAARPGEESK